MRGTAKCAYTLPVSRQQIGNAWWLLATLIPVTLNLITKLIAGAIATTAFSIPGPYLEWLAFSTVFDFAYAGAFYFLLTYMPVARPGGVWQNVRAGIFGVLWGLGVGGLFFIVKSLPAHWAEAQGWAMPALVLALGLTVAGYFRSAGLVVTRAGFRLTDTSGTPRTTREKTGSLDRQLSGLPRILWATFSTSVMMTAMVCTVFVGMMTLMLHQNMKGQSSGFYLGWIGWLLVMQNLRWVMTLRHLRVLPLSTLQLNGLLLTLNLTATLGLGVFVNLSHFFAPAIFPWQLAPEISVALAGFSCVMSYVAMRWGMTALIVCAMVMPMLGVVGLARNNVWLQSVLTPTFFYVAGLALTGLAGWLNQHSLAGNNAIYKPMKTPFAQAWGAQGF